MPCCARRTMTSSTSLIISGSRALVGSSKSMALGCMASERAMATRCCWPPESCAGTLSACSATPTRLSRSMARSRASSLETPNTSTGPSMTFCSTVICANRLNCWNTMPSSARMRARSLPSCGRGSPSMRISPESMVSKRLMVRHMVDLPEPEGPITTTTSPRSTERLMSLRTCRSP